MPSGIELLNLNNNSLSGQMSTSIGRLGALKELALERNAITGVIPTEIGLATSLINILQLNFNQISGSIPSEIGLLTSLLLFDASHNALTGTIPLEISSLQSLEGVDVGNNTLTGTPTPLFDLPAISKFYGRIVLIWIKILTNI
jgi:Leucine-rich repeat (LRR) protein